VRKVKKNVFTTKLSRHNFAGSAAEKSENAHRAPFFSFEFLLTATTQQTLLKYRSERTILV
jgi:hypothetical protein